VLHDERTEVLRNAVTLASVPRWPAGQRAAVGTGAGTTVEDNTELMEAILGHGR